MKGRGEKIDLDDVLRQWPEARDDARAATIMQRVESAELAALDDDALFGAPLLDDAAEAGSRARDRQNLQDLARLAQKSEPMPAAARAGSARGEDSGIVDLSILPVEQVAPANPRAAVVPAVPESAPAAAPVIALASRERPARAQRPYAIPLLLAGIAAAGVLWFRPQGAASPSATAPTATTTAPAASVAEAPPAPTATGVDPAALPEAKAAPAPSPAVIARGEPAKPAATARPPSLEAPTPAVTPSAKEDLNAALRKEMGDDGPPKTPAAAWSAADVPQKPSQGAVTGALGAVLPQARACLGPDDPISKASIVFTANGGVQSVTVTGGAAGKASEACIREALSKAKVQPFAEPTYPASVTVRHL